MKLRLDDHEEDRKESKEVMPTVMIDGKKHTPGSNTLKKLRRKAAAEAAKKKNASASKKSEPKSKPPVPKDRPKKKPANVKVPKGPTMVGGKRGGSAAHTKGGQGGAKYAKEEGMSALGIQLGVKKKPKAKLSK